MKVGSPKESTIEATGTPAGIRIAGTLAGLVGVLTLLTTLAVEIPALNPYSPTWWLPLAVGVAAGAGACIAAALIWQGRRAGVLVLVLAWAVPTFATLAVGEQATGNIFLTASLLLAAANWKSLR